MKSGKITHLIAAAVFSLLPLVSKAQTPTTAQGWATLSAEQFEQKKYDAASNSASECIKLAPNVENCYALRALAAGGKQDYKAALADMSKAIELAPKDAIYVYERGRLYFDQSRYAEAITDFTKAISMDASFKASYLVRSKAYCETNNLKMATADEAQFEKLGGKVQKTCFEMMKHKVAQQELIGNFQASKFYKEGLDNYKAGEMEFAYLAFSKVIELKPNDFQPYFYRALTKFHRDQIKDAAADFDQVLKLNPNFPDLYYYRGIIAFKAKQAEKAVVEFSKAIELNPTYAEAIDARGTIYFEYKMFPQAITDFSKVVTLKPSGEAYYRLGVAQYMSRNYDAAILAINKTIEAKFNLGIAYQLRASSYCALSKKDLAQADEKKVIEMGGKVETPCPK